MPLKNKKKTVPKILHVEINPSVMQAWNKFRKEKGMFRGPIVEQALTEFMERHADGSVGKLSGEEGRK